MTSDSRRRTSKPTAPHPDAILLWLMAEHTKAQARVEAAVAALEANSRKRRQRPIRPAVREGLRHRGCHSRAGRPHAGGSWIKARIAARYMQAPEDWGLRTYEVLGRFIEDILFRTAASRSGTLHTNFRRASWKTMT